MRYLYILIMTFLLTSCEEVINIDLKSTDSVIAAEGVIEAGSPAWIRLSFTSDYFNSQISNNIENAQVTIRDNFGNSELLLYQGSGLYKGSFLKGFTGRKYTLSFLLENKTYTAVSTLSPPSEINSVSFEEQAFQSPGEATKSYSLILRFSDNPDTENYYLIKFIVNGIVKDNNYTLLKDSYYSATNTIEYKSMSNRFEKGDKVLIKLYSIDKETYTYYSQLNDLMESEMGGSSTPYNPKSNFGAGVMGYFAAYSSSSYDAIVK